MKAAGWMRSEANRDDSRRHRLLIDLEQFDPGVSPIRSFETVDGPETRLDCVVGTRQSCGLLELPTIRFSNALTVDAIKALLPCPILGISPSP
jgi:hypothetical protein